MNQSPIIPAITHKDERGFSYLIADPSQIKYAERNAAIKALESINQPVAVSVEDSILSIYSVQARGGAKVKVDRRTVALAQDYIKYRDRGARVPKFGRWATGMFKDDKVLAADLATAGKWEESSSDIVISGSMIDILRAADTPHFSSCLTAGGGYGNVLPALCEVAGVAIAYVEDDKGKMRGRVWLHTAREKESGKECIVICQKWGGTLSARQVADLLKAKGVRAYVGEGYGRDPRPPRLAVEFYDNLTTAIHHDLYVWQNPFYVQNV